MEAFLLIYISIIISFCVLSYTKLQLKEFFFSDFIFENREYYLLFVQGIIVNLFFKYNNFLNFQLLIIFFIIVILHFFENRSTILLNNNYKYYFKNLYEISQSYEYTNTYIDKYVYNLHPIKTGLLFINRSIICISLYITTLILPLQVFLEEGRLWVRIFFVSVFLIQYFLNFIYSTSCLYMMIIEIKKPITPSKFMMFYNGCKWCVKYPVAAGFFSYLVAKAIYGPDYINPLIQHVSSWVIGAKIDSEVTKGMFMESVELGYIDPNNPQDMLDITNPETGLVEKNRILRKIKDLPLAEQISKFTDILESKIK